MATLNVIRHWALREQMSIREIARRTGLARNTVKKYLRSGESEPRYARRASSSKLDPYAEKLAGWLVTEATKSRKQRRTLRQIHTLSPKRRRSRTYPHREHLLLTKSVGQDSMENSGQTSAEFNTQRFAPGRQQEGEQLYPVHFCRDCDQEYHPVWRAGQAAQEYTPREIDDISGEDDDNARSGFLCPSNLFQSYKGSIEDLPESWLDLTKAEAKVRPVPGTRFGRHTHCGRLV